MKSLSYTLVLAIFLSACARNSNEFAETKAGRTVVTETFVSQVGGKTYGAGAKYRFTEDGRFIKRVPMKAIYSRDDRLSDGRKLGFGGEVTCNFVVDSKLKNVFLNDRLPRWDLGPYEIELSEERVTLDKESPFSKNDRLDESAAAEICLSQFTRTRLIEEIRIPNQYFYSFSGKEIRWSRGTGRLQSILLVTDLALGETLDVTEEAVTELDGIWSDATNAAADQTVRFSKEDRGVSLKILINDSVYPVRCLSEIKARMANVRMNSENELTVQLSQPILRSRGETPTSDTICQRASAQNISSEIKITFTAENVIQIRINDSDSAPLKQNRDLHLPSLTIHR